MIYSTHSKFRRILGSLLFAVLGLIAATPSIAQIPQVIAYQGFLSTNGTAFTGTTTADVFLFDAPNNGNQVWSHRSYSVDVKNGYYTVLMDFSTDWTSSSSRTFNNQYYAEILINKQLMQPRVQLTASPYAFNARIADSAIHIPQAPVGTIVAFGGDVLKLRNYERQLGWFVADGRRIARDSFPEYERMVGSSYGLSDNTDSLYLPDLRCMFLRGVNGGMTGARQASDPFVDPDAASRGMMRDGANQGNKVGSVQTDTVGAHRHIEGGTTPFPGSSYSFITGGNVACANTAGNSDSHPYTSTEGGRETRPNNAYVYWLIKVR